MNPARGDRFTHKHLIIGSPKAGTARPEVCTITRVTRYAIYYHNESGFLLKSAPLSLPVKEWL